MHAAPSCRPPLLAAAMLALAPAAAFAQSTGDTPPTELSPVRVQGRSAAAPTTEGSNAYTSGSTSTATGLGLSARDTPQSVSVVTRQRLDDQGLQSLTDVVQNVTGLSAKEYDSSRFGFSARGFDITSYQIDGLPTTWDAGWSAGETQTDLAIYDRVEVVRGATGLLTGAGSPSAAINLVRKHATSRTLAGSATLEAGSWEKARGTIDLSTPLDAEARVRGRVVASYQQNRSYTDLRKDRRTVLYGVIDADLTPSTTASLGASFQKNDPKGSTWGGLPSWYADGSRTDLPRSATTAANWSAWGSDQTTVFANIEHRFANGWTLRGAFNHYEADGKLRLLYLYGSPDRESGLGMGASPARYDTARKQDDVSLRASGPFELLGRRHELVLGVQHSEQKFKALSYDATDVAELGSFNGWDGSYPEPTWGATSVSDRQSTRQAAAFAAARLSLAEPLKLIVGARSTRWTRSGEDWSGLYRMEETKLTPYAGLIYDVSDALSAYASYTDIFEPQNYRDRNGGYLDPLVGKAYEVGMKGEWLDGRLTAALALFRIQQDNLAQADTGYTVPGTNPPAEAYYAAQGTRSQGYELEVSGELQRGWNLTLGWSQYTAKDAEGVPVNTNHPRQLLKLFTTYRVPALPGLTVGGGVNWESGDYTLATNPLGVTERLSQSSYALASLMARYEFSPALSAQINVNNLFDKTYYSQIGFYSQYAYGAPRNATASLTYRF